MSDMSDMSDASDMRGMALLVPGMTCGHCEAAVTAEVTAVAGVSSVTVDLTTKWVTVSGDALDEAALRAAVDEAGFDVEQVQVVG